MIALRGSIDPENERNPEKISLKVSSIADIAQLSRSAAKKADSGEKPPAPPENKSADKPAVKKTEEIHIRLKTSAAESDESLSSLRDYLAENSGLSSLFIHIPVSDGEKTIRAVNGVAFTANSGVDILEEIKECGCVAEAWRK
jgi:hypothetical protein